MREELPSRLAYREQQLQLVKQRVAREKEKFLEEHAREKEELMRQQQNLHFELASVNMTIEKNKSLQCIQKPLSLKHDVCDVRKLETIKDKEGEEQEKSNHRSEDHFGDPESVDFLGQYDEQESEDFGQLGPQKIPAELQDIYDEMIGPVNTVESKSPSDDSFDPMNFEGFMINEEDREGEDCDNGDSKGKC